MARHPRHHLSSQLRLPPPLHHPLESVRAPTVSAIKLTAPGHGSPLARRILPGAGAGDRSYAAIAASNGNTDLSPSGVMTSTPQVKLSASSGIEPGITM